MEVKVVRREFDIDGVKLHEYFTLATEETLPFLRAYSQFGDEHGMKVGDTVWIRDEHVHPHGPGMAIKLHRKA